jgi:hypothetical protein
MTTIDLGEMTRPAPARVGWAERFWSQAGAAAGVAAVLTPVVVALALVLVWIVR